MRAIQFSRFLNWQFSYLLCHDATLFKILRLITDANFQKESDLCFRWKELATCGKHQIHTSSCNRIGGAKLKALIRNQWIPAIMPKYCLKNFCSIRYTFPNESKVKLKSFESTLMNSDESLDLVSRIHSPRQLPGIKSMYKHCLQDWLLFEHDFIRRLSLIRIVT